MSFLVHNTSHFVSPHFVACEHAMDTTYDLISNGVRSTPTTLPLHMS